jgi:site-specific DNA-methyltransferase (adenine-specific)
MDELIKKNIKVDSIVTDPPYGMIFQSNHRKDQYKRIENDSNLDWLDDFIKKSYILAKDNTAHYFFCSFHNIDVFKQSIQKYFTVKNILVWEKNNHSMGDLENDFAPKVEFIIFAQKGQRKLNGKREPNIFKFNRTGNVLHPTEKPVDLMEFLISKVTNEGDVVFDPFMGSGSTGVAAVKSDRKFIGIEIENIYFETAKKRLNKTEKIKIQEW